jgi:phosphatidylglycerol:prolipoprotein diacylglycerol transferase
MYIHNLDPVLVDFGLIVIRWYSLAYIIGILAGWWLGKRIINYKNKFKQVSINTKEFDDLLSLIIISIIIGGRLGYILFYNLNFYLENPLETIKIWTGGMSFHGAMIGIIIISYFFSKKKNVQFFCIADVIACVAPIGIFFGRIANFINAELYGLPTTVAWSVIFPNIDDLPRHPSQLYESALEGILLVVILNFIIFSKNYKNGLCSGLFLFLYGIFRIFVERFREPDAQIGYLFGQISMGAFLSFLMVLTGIIIIIMVKRNEFKF